MGHFQGQRVCILETRKADIMKAQIEKFGGKVVCAPSLKEVPLRGTRETREFAERLTRDSIDAVIFMTGVGTQYLFDALSPDYDLNVIKEKLNGIFVIARGPKPVKVLNEAGIKIDLKISEPNTWKEILEQIESCRDRFNLSGKTCAVQEYGVSNTALIDGLEEKGAFVLRVPIYRWSLPDDISPLQNAIYGIIQGDIDIVMVTSGIQIKHLMDVAEALGKKDHLKTAFQNILISSIGPVSNESIEELDLHVGFNPSHPKMGTLVAETAEFIQSRSQKQNDC